MTEVSTAPIRPDDPDRAGDDAGDAPEGQVTESAAIVYEERFVPALFAPWADPMLDRVGYEPGDRLLDVGCGTGIVARSAARRAAAASDGGCGAGEIVGVDRNEGMLAVARRTPERVRWDRAPAEQLPYDDGVFDRVVCQFVMMFVTDRAASCAEMARVARPGGAVAVATWAAPRPGTPFAAMIDHLDRVVGAVAGDALRAPFALGDPADTVALFAPALDRVTAAVVDGAARFASLDAWVDINVGGWTFADMVDGDQLAELRAALRTDCAGFVGAGGTFEFPTPAIVTTGTAS